MVPRNKTPCDRAPYDYQIYISGFHQAGKTTLIHALDPYACSIEKPIQATSEEKKATTTVGFDLGQIIWARQHPKDPGVLLPHKEFKQNAEQYKGWITKRIHVKSGSGRLNFEVVRETLMTNIHGSLFLVDSTDKSAIQNATQILHETRAKNPNTPIHVVANKQDLETAQSPTEVAKWLEVTSAYGLSGKNDRSSCVKLTLKLLQQIEKRENK